MTTEQIENIKRSLEKVESKICEYCGIETNPGNYARWHGNKCGNRS